MNMHKNFYDKPSIGEPTRKVRNTTSYDIHKRTLYWIIYHSMESIFFF